MIWWVTEPTKRHQLARTVEFLGGWVSKTIFHNLWDHKSGGDKWKKKPNYQRTFSRSHTKNSTSSHRNFSRSHALEVGDFFKLANSPQVEAQSLCEKECPLPKSLKSRETLVGEKSFAKPKKKIN